MTLRQPTNGTVGGGLGRRVTAARWRVGNYFGRLGREVLSRALESILPSPPVASPAILTDAHRVLLVRTNFRLGNTIMISPLAAAFRRHSPAARIDFLGCDSTMPIVARLPVDRVHVWSRWFMIAPWRVVRLILDLRRERYDLAIDCGFGSFSAVLLIALSGARRRIGGAGRGDRLLTAKIPKARTEHVYDRVVAMGESLGLRCSDHPEFQVNDVDRETALRELASLGLSDSAGVRPFVGVFFGGHRAKRLPWSETLEILREVAGKGAPVLLAIGPEEAVDADKIARQLPAGVAFLPPRSLPVLAAVWSLARLVVAPDSGPMHLAVAVGTPTVGLLSSPRSWRFRPRGAYDVALLKPTPAESAAAITRLWFHLTSSTVADERRANGAQPPSGAEDLRP